MPIGNLVSTSLIYFAVLQTEIDISFNAWYRLSVCFSTITIFMYSSSRWHGSCNYSCQWENYFYKIILNVQLFPGLKNILKHFNFTVRKCCYVYLLIYTVGLHYYVQQELSFFVTVLLQYDVSAVCCWLLMLSNSAELISNMLINYKK